MYKQKEKEQIEIVFKHNKITKEEVRKLYFEFFDFVLQQRLERKQKEQAKATD